MYQSPAEVAKLIGKSRKWVIDRCKEHKLPCIFENGRYLVNVKKINAALELLETESVEKINGCIFSKSASDYLYN